MIIHDVTFKQIFINYAISVHFFQSVSSDVLLFIKCNYTMS